MTKRPIALSGPSGVGKGTMIDLLLKEFPDKFKLSTSHTTRAPRPGEVHGVHYFFVTREDFTRDIAEGQFIEYNEYNNNLYGTSVKTVAKISEDGKICVLDVDIHGSSAIKKTNLNARLIFVTPGGANPIDELYKRLKGRGTDSEAAIQNRLAIAEKEFTFFIENDDLFDFVLVNDTIENCFKRLKEFLQHDLV